MKFTLIFLLLFYLVPSAWAQQLLQERIYKTQAAASIIQAGDYTREGNVIYAGIGFKAVDRYEASFLLVKPDADTLWTRKGPQVSRYEADIKQAPGGGYIFAGGLRPTPLTSINYSDMVLQRLTSTGMTIWTKPYPKTTDSEIPRAMALMPDKGYIIGVSSDTKPFVITHTDSMGAIKWQKDYSWATSEGIADLKLAPNGNIIAAGITGPLTGPFHIKVMIFNQNGDSLNGKQLIVTGFNRMEVMYSDANTITPLSDGGFLLTGRVDTTISGNPIAAMGMLIKLDSDLNIVWKYIHRTNPVQEYLFSEAKELADGSIIVLGFQVNNSINAFSLFHFSGPAFNVKTVYPFTSNLCSSITGSTLTELNDSTFLIGGQCQNGNAYSMYVAKAKIKGLPHNITSIKPDQIQASNALGQGYPNPAQNQAIIPYHLPNSTRSAKILLTDITGREVGSYALKQKQGSLPVDVGRLSNGLYLYSLVVDGKPVATKKLAVAR